MMMDQQKVTLSRNVADIRNRIQTHSENNIEYSTIFLAEMLTC